MSDIVQQVGGFWQTLRHDGIDYASYIEHLTYLLFLKMADELGVELPKGCDWHSLVGKSDTALRDHYVDLLRKLGEQRGVLGSVFRRAQPTFSNSVNLRKLLSLIDETDWTALDFDPNAARIEGLNTGIGLDPANEQRDPDPRRQVFRLLILCRRLLAILIKESASRLGGKENTSR
jgi:type I restriction enzyme M protein